MYTGDKKTGRAVGELLPFLTLLVSRECVCVRVCMWGARRVAVRDNNTLREAEGEEEEGEEEGGFSGTGTGSERHCCTLGMERFTWR